MRPPGAILAKIRFGLAMENLIKRARFPARGVLLIQHRALRRASPMRSPLLPA